MKILFTVCVFLLFNNSNAQTLLGQIMDSITHKPIDLANVTFISTNFGVFSDSKGGFKINLNNNKDCLLISNIGYTDRIVSLSNFNEKKDYEMVFYLSPKTEALSEVIIYNKKIEYSWDKILKTKRENSIYLGFQFGTEHCTYIANPYRKKGRIKSVSLELEKHKGYLEHGKRKIDYVASYNIKFYNYDNKNNKPGVEVYNKNIITDPENKTYTLKIDLDSLRIPFPENGVCVGVEMINTKYQNPKKVFAFIGPLINFSENKDSFPITTWVRYRNTGQWVFKPTLGFPEKNGKKQRVMIVDLVVNTEK